MASPIPSTSRQTETKTATQRKQPPPPSPPNIDPKELLTRYLYISDYHGQFVTGDNDKYLATRDYQPIIEWLKQSHEEFIETIRLVNNQRLFTQRRNLFYLLSVILTTDRLFDIQKDDETLKRKIRELLFECCRNDDEFFDFIRYFSTIQRNGTNKPKLSKRLRNIIVEFYNNKTPMEFAQSVGTFHSRHGWSHKDLIKLCHYKPENLLSTQIVNYVLFGFDQIRNDDNPEFQEILEHLRLAHELRTTEDIQRAALLIGQLHASVGQINSKLNKKERAWCELLPEMPLRDILKSIPKLYKLNWLNRNSIVMNSLLDCLTDTRRLINSELHPIEIYIYKTIAEKGGKRPDPQYIAYLRNKEEYGDEVITKIITPKVPYCPAVFYSITKFLIDSYKYIKPIGKRILITIHVNKMHKGCFQNRTISACEAAASIILFFLKAEAQCTLAAFYGNHIKLIEVSRRSRLDELMGILQQYRSKYMLPQAPFDYAISTKRSYDIFINFQTSKWMKRVPKHIREDLPSISEVLKKYCETKNLPNTKLVRFCLTSHNVLPFENSKNILNIAGFTDDVPRVLEAFCRGNFV